MKLLVANNQYLGNVIIFVEYVNNYGNPYKYNNN